MNVQIVVLNCQKCKQCLNGLKSLGLLFELSVKEKWPFLLLQTRNQAALRSYFLFSIPKINCLQKKRRRRKAGVRSAPDGTDKDYNFP